jgi:hypothetical protein
LGLRVVIDQTNGKINYFTNTGLRANSQNAFVVNISGNVGEITAGDFVSGVTGSVTALPPYGIRMNVFTHRAFTAGQLIASQSFTGCGRNIRIPVAAVFDVVSVEGICECADCRDLEPGTPFEVTPTLNVVICAVTNVIKYYNDNRIASDFAYTFNIGTGSAAEVEDIRQPSGAYPRWPLGSLNTTFFNAAENIALISGIMGEPWAAGQVIATQAFSGSPHSVFITGEAISVVVIVSCTTCVRALCICCRDCEQVECVCVRFSYSRGVVTGGDRLRINDALQILRYLVGLSSEIASAPFAADECMIGFNAARSVTSWGFVPNILDALQILRRLVGVPSTLDDCPPDCSRSWCRRSDGSRQCQDFRCRQCTRVNCVCEGVMRVEIDARQNLMRFFHDKPLRGDLGYSFSVRGNGVTINRVAHEIPEVRIDPATGLPRGFITGEGAQLIENSGGNSLLNENEVAFAIVLARGATTGALVAVMTFSGNPENIRFEEYPGAAHDFPIGNVTIIR